MKNKEGRKGGESRGEVEEEERGEEEKKRIDEKVDDRNTEETLRKWRNIFKSKKKDPMRPVTKARNTEGKFIPGGKIVRSNKKHSNKFAIPFNKHEFPFHNDWTPSEPTHVDKTENKRPDTRQMKVEKK